MDVPAPPTAAHTCPVCRDLLEDSSGLCARCGALVDPSGGIARARGMACFSCGYQADAVGERCPGCGTAYTVECDGCGGSVAVGRRRCPHCGFDVAGAAFERVRRARVADSVGASRPGRLNRLIPGLLSVALLLMAGAFVYRPEAFQARFMTWTFLFSILLFVLLMQLFGGRLAGRRRGRRRWRVKGELVEVYRTFDLPRAEHLVQVLTAERVPAFLHNQYVTTLTPFSFRGIEVMVPTVQAAEAIGVMKAFGFDPDIELDDDPATVPPAPAGIKDDGGRGRRSAHGRCPRSS